MIEKADIILMILAKQARRIRFMFEFFYLTIGPIDSYPAVDATKYENGFKIYFVEFYQCYIIECFCETNGPRSEGNYMYTHIILAPWASLGFLH